MYVLPEMCVNEESISIDYNKPIHQQQKSQHGCHCDDEY
jgi:hypothetical protein